MTDNINNFLTSLFSCFLLTSCLQSVQLPDGPPAYRQGYDNGCSSGYFEAGNETKNYVKDTARYYFDKLYSKGWDLGFKHCNQWPYTY